MKKFGEALGLGDFAPAADGRFSLSVDGTVVSFLERPERGQLDIVARICDLPSENADMVLKALMSAMAPGNAAEDYSFFFADGDDGICLRRTERLADLDVEGTRLALEKFANALDEWRSSVGDFLSVLPVVNEAIDRDKMEARSFGLGEQGFLQV